MNREAGRVSKARPATSEDTDGRSFLLIRSTEYTPHARSRPVVDAFNSEGAAREAFRRLRLEVGPGSAWGQLVAVDKDVVHPLCWFGQAPELVVVPRRACPPRRRMVLVALATVIGAVGWAAVAGVDRAGAAVAPYVSWTGLVTVTGSQHAEATVVDTSDACLRTEIWLIDGEGRTVASQASTVPRTAHLRRVQPVNQRAPALGLRHASGAAGDCRAEWRRTSPVSPGSPVETG